MKAFYRLLIGTLLCIALLFTAANLLLRREQRSEGRQYRVDAARAAAVIASKGAEALCLSDYETLCGVTLIEGEADLLGADRDYLIREAGGRLYRFDYRTPEDDGAALRILNLSLGVMAILVLALLLYVQLRILRPFSRMRELPLALSKGTLSAPLPESRQRFFGRFLWGMNMLRETMEAQKQRELSLQAEKKKLILSISHDIKIPLSAIKLYAKAMEKGLYGEERRAEIAEKLSEKADEITAFVTKIVQASNEDFLALTVNNGEFYLSALLDSLRAYYTEKLRLLNIAFHMEAAPDCLLTGDPDRALEVMQNIVENAIKYGDGGSVSILIRSEENCRLLTVENSGCTLPPEEQPHMFDSFWRGTNAARQDGSGLGLYICRTLMLKMGGEIFAEAAEDRMRVTAVFYCVNGDGSH